MATDDGVTLGAWFEFVRRARIDGPRKHFALTVGSYANNDGTEVRCGIASLAVDCQIGYSTARRHLKWMRDIGLIELQRPGNKRKQLADVYRLWLGPELIDHLDVPDPDEYKALKAAIHDTNRTGQQARRARVQRSPIASADESAATDDQRSPMLSAGDEPDADDQRSHSASAESAISAHSDAISARPWASPHLPTNTSPPLQPPQDHSMADLRTAVTPPRATQNEQIDSIGEDSDALPTSVHPSDTASLRQILQAAAARRRTHNRRPGAFQELMAATTTRTEESA